MTRWNPNSARIQIVVFISPPVPSLARENLATFMEYSRQLIADAQEVVAQARKRIAESQVLRNEPKPE
jgi:hypothetical protein